MANTIAPANTIATTNINSNSNNQKESNTKHGTTKRSFLCIFLTVGLLLTFLDVLYIMLYLSPDQPFNNADRQHHHRAVVMALVDAGSRRSTAADTENSNPDPAAASRQQHYNLPVTRAKDRAIQTLPSDWTNDDSPGKDENAPNNKQQQQQQNSNNNPIVQLLTEAMGVVDPATAARLPSSHAVAALYGRDPVVLGLESCAAFRSHNPFVRDPADHFVATAGTFNTGTNLMAELLIANCVLPERQQKYGTRGVRWQVVWGKHTPVDDEAYRQSHRTYDDVNLQANAMFPAVMVRDPFKWMQSVRVCVRAVEYMVGCA